ncbi:MAG: class I SAM-dependent methyltransferase [Candidatus Latescibacteria bacterium]|nr:class I SAM-dependent methyltransferase [Candidatus Latescibacterota bacterium]
MIGHTTLTMIWRKKKITCNPYLGLAPIYDFVMRHLDYQGWADYLEQIISRLSPPGRRTLELACGTGNLTLELARRGYEVVGTDISKEMLEMAQGKTNTADGPVLFRQMDMRHIEISGHFDIVLCLYDSINYLMQKREVEKVLQGVHSLLSPGGIFIFDICTETNSLRYFRDRTEKEKGKGFSYWRHSYYLRPTRIQITEFKINFDHQDKVLTELHRQRIYSLDDILQMLNQSAFTSVEFYDNQTFRPGSEDSDRIHFVLQKYRI